MNDIILSGLLNLFALFGTITGINREKAQKVLTDYLTRYFGVRKLEDYLGIYNDLRDLYELQPQIDKDAVLKGICTTLNKKLLKEEQSLLLLRFMEFSFINPQGFINHIDLFETVARWFGVSDNLFTDFQNFVQGKASGNVATFTPEGFSGPLHVLYIDQFNKMLVSYHGNDEVQLNDVPVLKGIFLVFQQSGVIKNHASRTVYYSDIRSLFEKDKNALAIEMAGDDINFRFPGSDNGMHNLSFRLHSGQLVAIMGGSGVGKSTLLGLLNGNIRPQEGSITINGLSITQDQAKNLIGFVPQDDLLIEELTVYENLWYTAKMCFADMSPEDMDHRVMEVLTELGLAPAKDLKVGSAINKFISGGQRKRLNIALELIRQPAVLFLDEPTSGLSSTDSEKVVNLLKEQTHKGRLIVVNIHQPSSDIFKLFDRLWLLDKGGYPVYDGNPIEALTYFKRAVNYADAELSTCPSCGNVNPEVVLNIIDAKAIDDSGQLTEKRKVSPQDWHNRYLESREKMSAVKETALPPTRQKKPGAWKQFLIYLERNIKTKITNTQYLVIAILEAPVLAGIVSLLTRYAPPQGYSVMDNKNLVSYFFMAIIVSIFMGMSMSAEEIIKDRALLKRERFLRLSNNSYIWSKIVFLMALSLLQTLLFIIVGNLIMGIHDLFRVWWIILFMSAFVANLTGLWLSQTLNSIVAIYITIPLLLIPQILLCGLVVKFDDLKGNSPSNEVPVIGDFIPSRWAYEALAVASFADNAYMKPYFEYEKEKFNAQYYRSAYLKELRSQLETTRYHFEKNDSFEKYLPVLKNEIPKIASICTLPTPALEDLVTDAFTLDTYSRIDSFFSSADSILSHRSTHFTLAIDRLKTQYISTHSKEELVELEKNHHNKNLEDLLLNVQGANLCEVRESNIVPKVGSVFLPPAAQNGRTAFYSHEKVLGRFHIPTLWYNMGILLIMSLLVSIALFYDFPGRFLRKQRD